ncbi:MAG: PH domain-containing protein [Micrococcaceae bacterium]|nr:PH domain-containing protein [Micrococcaceae bacterium]
MSTQHSSVADWQRLSGRIIWVDLAQIVITQLPLVIAIWVMGVSLGAGQLWPLVGLAAVGLIGAVGDAIRWLVTRYRVTPTYVELKTGVLFRRHRSIQRDRIRSIDTEAKLRHRIAGLRVVTIGAGQQPTADEAALELDALIAADAGALRQRLLSTEQGHSPNSDVLLEDEETPEAPAATDREVPLQVFARFRPGWVVYNIFNIWAYLVALGLVGGGWWILSTLNIDVAGLLMASFDWASIGWIGTTVIVVIAVGLVGMLGMTVDFFTDF